jgi:hypothetical protein
MEIRGLVDWCTSIPLDIPLARLVTADPGTKMIEHDLMPLYKSERLSSTRAADATIPAKRGTAPHQAVGGTTMLDPVH